MKSAAQWTVPLNSELCTIPSQRTRSDPEAIRATIQAAQADALRHAMRLCAGVSMNCGQLKEAAIRQCIRAIEAEVAKVEGVQK